MKYTELLQNNDPFEKKTPQTQPILGLDMVENNAGGYVFKATDMDRVRRFLILGTEGSTYYQSAQELTLENARHTQQMLVSHGKEVIDMIVDISDRGLAVKNDPAIFALAMASVSSNKATRKLAFEAFPKVSSCFGFA